MSARVQTQSKIRESLDRLRPNVHSCLIYENAEEQFAAVVPFIALGLERGEKCLYLADETNAVNVIRALNQGGVDAEAAMNTGALNVIPTRAAVPGASEETLELLRKARVTIATDTFPAVRIAREITRRPGEPLDQQRLATAEVNVAACFAGQNFIDLSQYNSRELSPQDLLNVIRTHALVIWNGAVCENLHANHAEERLAPEPTSNEVERVLANLHDRQAIEDNLREESGGAVILPVESLLTGAPSPQSHSGCGTCLTHIGKLQEQISHAQKMEALALMASGMVHQFRNFLSVVQGCGEMLLETLETSDKRTNLVQRILDASQSAALLSNHLLAFGRPPRIRAEVVDLNTAVADLEADLRETAGEGIVLRVVPAAAPCPVKIDEGQLEQVLINLLANSCDAMPQGGTITISTATADLANDDVRLHPGLASGHYVALSFTDTGIGIDPRAQKRVFEPFFTSKQPGRGLGLGLSIVHGIVQNHFRGAISLESSVGGGTTFTIYIPRVDCLQNSAAAGTN